MKKKLFIATVGVFLLTGVISLSIFSNKDIKTSTISINNSKLNIVGTLNLKESISEFKVTATGSNELLPYNIIYNGSNTNLTYKLYKTSEHITKDKLKDLTPVETGTLNDNTTIIKDEFITSTTEGDNMYYYLVLENISNNNFKGELKLVNSNAKPNINVIAAYIEGDDGTYTKTTEKFPQTGYTIDTERSVCSNGAIPSWDNKNNGLLVTSLTKNETECYLYYRKKTPIDNIQDNSLGTVDSFTGPSCEASSSNCGASGATNMQQNGVYEAEDDFGTSYYYRGTVDNNWVVFGKEGEAHIWWRIIRINGNGSIRIIYAGTSTSTTEAPNTTGDETMINPKQSTGNSTYKRAVYFNKTSNDNKYIGYMYNSTPAASTNHDQAHKVDSSSTKSDVLTQIEQWYNSDTNLSSLADKYIDVDTGFCSDSTIAKISHGSSYTGQGYGTQQTAYAGLDRVWQQGNTSDANPQTPTFKCGYTISAQQTDTAAIKRDLYTGPNATVTKGNNNESVEGNNALPVPAGLITMDEVIYAGGFYLKANANYWLTTDKLYWTMTPSYTNSSGNASVFVVGTNGQLNNNGVISTNYGARPVINLKANTKFAPEGDGTAGNPYVVITDNN